MPFEQRKKQHTIDKGGEPPDDGFMEQRIERLESELASIKLDLGILKANAATKADLAEAKSAIIMWVVSAIFLAQLLPAILKLLTKQ